jgi:DNA-binding CsgD family transcriptional regulator
VARRKRSGDRAHRYNRHPEEPLRIRLTRAVSCLELSPRQPEVCVLMASGISRNAIADRLGIRQNTVREHGRWIYNKFDVHSRSELLGKLLTTTADKSRWLDARYANEWPELTQYANP